MSSLLFGSCFGVAANDYHSCSDAADGWYLCPSTVPYLLPTATAPNTLDHHQHDDDDDDDDVKQQQQKNINAKVSSSPSSPLRVGAHRNHSKSNNNNNSKNNINLLARVGEGARHLRRHEAALQQMSPRRPGLLLLQGSTLSKHTGSSPEKTEPSTDGDDEEEEQEATDVQALVELCVRECEFDEDCVAEPHLMVEDNDNDNDDPYMEAFGLQKNASGIIELLSAEQAQQEGQGQRRCDVANTPGSPILHHQLAHHHHHQQQRHGFIASRGFWNHNSLFTAATLAAALKQQQQQEQQQQHLQDVNFHPTTTDEPDDDAHHPQMVCIYRPRRSWPNDGEVRIRWALSRNTSPTTAVILERWTAAVELSNSPSAVTTTTTTCSTSDQEEFPTRLLNLSETNDTTTARLDGMVEIHDETTTRMSSLSLNPPQDNEDQAGAVPAGATPSDAHVGNSREIAWLTCYRIVFDEHEDNINDTEKKDDTHNGTAGSSPTLIPDPNGTVGYSEKKLATRRLFAQFDDARHGPLRQVMMERAEKEAHDDEEQQQQQQQQADSSRPCSPATSRSIPATPSSAAAAHGGGDGDDIFLNNKGSSLLLPEQQQQHESSSSCHVRSKKSHQHHQYFVIQDFSVHEDYRGMGLGLCLLDDACRRICDSKAWVLVALPQPTTTAPLETEASSSSNNTPPTPNHRNRRFSLGRASWSSMTSSLLSSSSSARDKKPSTPEEAETLSSLALTEQPQQQPDPDTLLSYLGLLGFERLADSPFCVRWNKSDHLPTIEEICPHVPIFHPSPPPPPLQSPQHRAGGGSGSGDAVCETQHPSSPSST